MSEAISPSKNLSNAEAHEAENSAKNSRNHTLQPQSPNTRSTRSIFMTNAYGSAKKEFDNKAKMDEVYNNHEKLNDLVEVASCISVQDESICIGS